MRSSVLLLESLAYHFFRIIPNIKTYIPCLSLLNSNGRILETITDLRQWKLSSLNFPRTLAQEGSRKAIRMSVFELVGFSAVLFSLPIRTKERHNELSVIHKIEYTVLIGPCLVLPSVCTVCRNVELALRQFFDMSQFIFFVKM